MNRKISVGMTVTIVILAMTVTFSITMLMAMRLFDHTVTSVKEKESMYEKITFFSSGGSNGNKSLCMWRWFFHNSNYSSGSK